MIIYLYAYNISNFKIIKITLFIYSHQILNILIYTLQEPYTNFTNDVFDTSINTHFQITKQIDITNETTEESQYALLTASDTLLQYLSLSDCYIDLTINSSINNLILNIFTNDIPVYLQNCRIRLSINNLANQLNVRLTSSTAVYVNTFIELNCSGYIYTQRIFGYDIVAQNLGILTSSQISSDYNGSYTSCNSSDLISSNCYENIIKVGCNFQQEQQDQLQDRTVKIGYCSSPGICNNCDQNSSPTGGDDNYCNCTTGYYIANNQCRQLFTNERGSYFNITGTSQNQIIYWSENDQPCNTNYTYNETTRQCYKNCDQSCNIVSDSTQDCDCTCGQHVVETNQTCSQQCESGYYYSENQCYSLTQNEMGNGYIQNGQLIYTNCSQNYELQQNDCVFVGFGENQIVMILIIVVVVIFIISVIILIISAILNKRTKIYNQKLMN